MKKIKISGLVIVAVMMTTICSAQNMSKETTVEVGGAPMYPSKNIIENAVNSKDQIRTQEVIGQCKRFGNDRNE